MARRFFTPPDVPYLFGRGAPDEPMDVRPYGLQPGVWYRAASVTLLTATSVRVAAGAGWVPTGALGTSGQAICRFVSWPQTDVTVPVSTGSRLDQIAVYVDGSVGRVAGAESAAAASATAGLDARTGAAALPTNALRLADVLANTSGVPAASHIRDRAPWCRGARRVIYRDSSITVTNTAEAAVDLQTEARIELGANSYVTIGVHLPLTGSVANVVAGFRPSVNGAGHGYLRGVPLPVANLGHFYVGDIAEPHAGAGGGSFLIGLLMQTSTGTLTVGPGTRLVLEEVMPFGQA